MKHSTPATPPATIASNCLLAGGYEGLVQRSAASAGPRSGRRTGTGCRRGTGCCPSAACRCAASATNRSSSVYWSRSKRIRLPTRNTDQADVRVEAEQEAVQYDCRCSCDRSWLWCVLADDVDGLRLAGRRPGPWTSSRRRPAARPSSRPAVLPRRAARPAPSRPPAPAARRARWRSALSRCCSALKSALRMCAISPRNARASRGGCVDDELQHHGQVVRQLAWRQVQAGLLVGLREVDHRRAAVARVAMHVLEQVQRRGAAAVEQLARSRPRRPADRRCASVSISASSSAWRAADSARSLRRTSRISARWPRSVRIGIAQQRGQHAQAAGGRHGISMSPSMIRPPP